MWGKSEFFRLIWKKIEEVNSYSVKPVLAELSKNNQLIWVELSLAWSGFDKCVKFQLNPVIGVRYIEF